MQKKRSHRIFSLIAVLMLLISTIGTTQAAWKTVNDSVQEIDLTGVQGKIIEEYERAEGVYPGNTVPKIVHVKNTGASDMVVRIKTEKAWGETRDESGKLQADSTFSTDNIVIHYNTQYWQYDAKDGYYYYKGVLQPDETTLEPLFESFQIKKDTGNEYQGLEADIFVRMECVQAGFDGLSIWGKTFAGLGISYTPASPPETQTKVTFAGGNEGFVFDPDSTDLFANFKGLLPGETRSQKIEITNTFEIKTGVEIFLRAEDINQSFTDDPETLALVNRLLREYASIIVTDDSGSVLYDGPVWGNPESGQERPASMGQDISLGMFATGETKTLQVQLHLDPAMDNEYQNLMGLIKWVWTAQDTNYETVTVEGAKTWLHGANPVKERPQEIVIHVKADGEIVATETVTAADHWRWSFTLPKYDKFGNEIQYTIEEEPIPGYETEIVGSDVTNTHDTYEEVTVSGTKTWEHGNNKKHPGSIVIHVKNGDEILISQRVTAEDNWAWSFTLPKYDEAGKAAKYVIEEDPVKGYTLAENEGYDLTNEYVHSGYPGDNPKTGDTTHLWIWGSLMAGSAILLIVSVMTGRKQKEAQA